jgi:hypothetical protein
MKSNMAAAHDVADKLEQLKYNNSSTKLDRLLQGGLKESTMSLCWAGDQPCNKQLSLRVHDLQGHGPKGSCTLSEELDGLNKLPNKLPTALQTSGRGRASLELIQALQSEGLGSSF